MTNKEKFLALVSKEKTNTVEEIKARIKNRAMLRESSKIAIRVLKKLDELGWSQKDLAEKMGVSPQQVNKIVKGQENLTLETQVKLQEILDIAILASYHETQLKKWVEEILFKKEFKYSVVAEPVNSYASESKVVKMKSTENDYYNSYSEVG